MLRAIFPTSAVGRSCSVFECGVCDQAITSDTCTQKQRDIVQVPIIHKIKPNENQDRENSLSACCTVEAEGEKFILCMDEGLHSVSLLLCASNLMSWPDHTRRTLEQSTSAQVGKFARNNRATPCAAGSLFRAIAPAFCPQSHVHVYCLCNLQSHWSALRKLHGSKTLRLTLSDAGKMGGKLRWEFPPRQR